MTIKNSVFSLQLAKATQERIPALQKVMSEMGPVPDTTRLLAGHYANEPLPEIDLKMIEPGKWYLTEKNLTAWVGPWGISYSANLTPDKATGIGALSRCV